MNSGTINTHTKQQAMDIAYKAGFVSEASKTNCSQATFHAVMHALGFKNPMIFKTLSAFEGGGAVTTYGNCGAFSGALATFGFFFGRTYEQWEQGKPYIKASILGQKLFLKFEEKYETVICRQIHEKIFGRTFDLMDRNNLGVDKKELDEFEKNGAHKDKCPSVVGLVSSWTVDILWDLLPKDTDLTEIKISN